MIGGMDIFAGLLVVVLVGAALLYIRREKKKGVTCIGCPNAGTCHKHQDRENDCGCHTEK